MKRAAMIITVVSMLAGLAPLALAAGGQAPGSGEFTIQNRPLLVGSFLIDPHEGPTLSIIDFTPLPPVTPTAKQGTAVFERGNRSVPFLFNIPEATPFACGCDPMITRLRFLGKKVNDFVGQATLDQIFARLNITPPVGGDLVITQILSRRCLPDPNLDPALIDANGQIMTPVGQAPCLVVESQFVNGPPGAGLFKLEVLMQFQVPTDGGGD